MEYFVALASAWLLLSASTALRPGRRGIFFALAYPVGWAAGELAAQALVIQIALVGLLKWWGWPHLHWVSDLVLVLASLVVAENLALVFISFHSRSVVRRALSRASFRPLSSPLPREDRFGTWWRTALQVPYHPHWMQLIKNVPYGPEPRHRLDVWRNSTTPLGAPVIFYIHGGAWTFGDKREQGRPMLHEFVARGWIAVACNYRLAPTHPWPAQIEDVTRTLAWIKKYIASYGGDPDRVVVAGGSAGGHLAALLALSSDDPSWRPRDVEGVTDWSVRGAIPLYGVLEMTGDDAYWNGLGRGIRGLLERRVVQEPYQGNEDLYLAISPLQRIHPDAPPFLVVHGVNDTLVDMHVARSFVREFRAHALAPIYYVELPFTQHAFDVSASPRTSATTRAAIAFADSVSAARPEVPARVLANYRVPPGELVVEVAGEWVPAPEAVATFGPLWVVSADNPYSRRLSEQENERRRAQMVELLTRHGVRAHATLARGQGDWPDEAGVALMDSSLLFAKGLARTFDQYAFYEVTSDAVRVRRTVDAALI